MTKKDPKKLTNKPDRKSIAFFLLFAVAAGLYLSHLLSSERPLEDVPYSQFLSYLDSGRLSSVTLSENRIIGELRDAKENEKKHFMTYPIADPGLAARIEKQQITFRGQPATSPWGSLLLWILPIAFFYYFLTFALGGLGRGGPGSVLGMTKSKARIFVEKDIKTTFADVAGIEEAKTELGEIISFLKDPTQYSRLGGHAPKGVLLVGPPGTGKTLLARALAGEATVPFLSINGSEFVELFVGIGAARVRDLFEQARQQAPCILFIDEIDALGKSRALGLMGANDEKEQTLNQLLAEMDGFDSSHGVIILAATNRPEILDPALLRAGRFDRQVLVNFPDREGRVQILKVHAKKVKLSNETDLDHIASLTPGFSGADLANLVNEAAIIATRRKADSVTQEDFTHAIERIVAGLEQKRKAMNPEEKRRIAFHEMGHATVALSIGTEKVHKISIIPRGLGALGYTLQRPTEDRYLMEKEEMMRKIAILLGGRASETIFLGTISTGASDDLVKATNIARAMVAQYGMSDKIGLTAIDQRVSPYLHSQAFTSGGEVSDKTAEMVDSEVKSFLEEGLRIAVKSLERNRAFIERGARVLLEIETLDESQIQNLWMECAASSALKPNVEVTPQPNKPVVTHFLR